MRRMPVVVAPLVAAGHLRPLIAQRLRIAQAVVPVVSVAMRL